MSGINKLTRQERQDRRNAPKPTMEQQYREMKNAAETYQILQVGICCVEQDRERGDVSQGFGGN